MPDFSARGASHPPRMVSPRFRVASRPAMSATLIQHSRMKQAATTSTGRWITRKDCGVFCRLVSTFEQGCLEAYARVAACLGAQTWRVGSRVWRCAPRITLRWAAIEPGPMLLGINLGTAMRNSSFSMIPQLGWYWRPRGLGCKPPVAILSLCCCFSVFVLTLVLLHVLTSLYVQSPSAVLHGASKSSLRGSCRCSYYNCHTACPSNSRRVLY